MPRENDLEGKPDMGGKHGGQAGQPKPPPRPRRRIRGARRMKMSWQSATPAKPVASPADQHQIAPRFGRTFEAVAPAESHRWNGITSCRYCPAGPGRRNGGWHVFWIYWDTAWSLVISGIMFATIVTHPDAEFVEVHAAKRRM